MKPPEELRSAGMRVSRDVWGRSRRSERFVQAQQTLVLQYNVKWATTYGASRRNVREI